MRIYMNLIKYIVLITGLLFTTIAICFVGDVFAKRVLGLGEPIVYDAHALWGYAPRENRKYLRFNNSKVNFNNVGARGVKDWDKQGNNIVFIGDSVTYGGSYIDNSETFASISCQELQDWVCHNAGVNSYGVINMVARSRYDKRINDAPVVIFTLITGDFDRGLQKKDNAHFILREPPKIFSGLWEILNFISARITPKKWFGKNSDLTDEKRLLAERDLNRKFALDVFLSELQRLEEQNFEFLIFHSPSVYELENQILIQENEILQAIRKKYSLKFYFLSDFLQEHYDNETQLYTDAVHFSKTGHKEVAKIIKPLLLTLVRSLENR